MDQGHPIKAQVDGANREQISQWHAFPGSIFPTSWQEDSPDAVSETSAVASGAEDAPTGTADPFEKSVKTFLIGLSREAQRFI